jgi:predicted nucleotidyltransferase component of viral defense system
VTAPKNVAVSVRQRLLNHARETKSNFDEILRRFAIERLLFRLGCSKYRERFVLKGATLFTLWGGGPHRPTQDLDLLGYGANDFDELERVFREVVVVPEEDGLVFLPDTVRAERIREDQEYEGVRITLIAMLAGARIPMQVDVGFGDAVHPDPLEEVLPTLLPMEAPRLRVYPRETVIAEKLQAIVLLGEANSRLKDYYDLWFLATHYSFSGEVLATATRNTFERRRTALPTGMPVGLTPSFCELPAKKSQWQAFQRRAGLADRDLGLTALVETLAEFVMPLLVALRDEPPFTLVWNPAVGWTEK